MSASLPTSIKLSPKAKDDLRVLQEEMGLSRSKVFEVAVRLLARSQKVKLPKGAWFPESDDSKGDDGL